MTTIPASEIVAVSPSVLGAGGSALDLVGLLLTTSTRPPIGTVQSFPDADSVSDYFGAGSAEALAATVYFAGFQDAAKRPGSMLFAQYNTAAVAGYIRGGSMQGVALSAVQAATGQFIISVDGVVETIANVDLSGAASLSAAATLLQTAINADAGGNVTVVYDSVSQGFIITSVTTGASSSISFASGSGTVDTVLKLTAATGAVQSPGAITAVPGTFMDALVAVNANWASFATEFNPDNSGNANKLLFAAWAAAQNDRFVYVCWDTDVTATQSVPATGSLGYLLAQENNTGTALIYAPDATLAVFIMGAIASVDFEEANGRVTFAFKTQAGLVASVTTATAAVNLGGNPQTVGSRGNGYNFYGAYGAANQNFTWFQRGFITGDFLWLDSFIDQIWLNNILQIALLNFFASARSVPFSDVGKSLIESALADPIAAGLNFGAFAPGTITQAQRAEVNQAAGSNIADSLQTQGYYVQVVTASGTVRASRGPQQVKFWYLDRGAVQSITLSSIAVQ